MTTSIDVLMITHKRPEYLRLSLPRLIESLDDDARLWIWHNGDDRETLDIVKRYASHGHVQQFHHSSTNRGIRTPTNWMWGQSSADFVSKVDDDCLVDEDWISRLRSSHLNSPETGIIGSWRFYDEDLLPHRIDRKTRTLSGGAKILQNHWVQGSGYLARRSLVDEIGLIREAESFPDWCIRAARGGAVNGWALPFVHEEHMDDPRSPWTIFTDDEAFRANRPLSAIQTGVTTTDGWTRQMRRSARVLQKASLDIRRYGGWRRKLMNARIRASDMLLRQANNLHRR